MLQAKHAVVPRAMLTSRHFSSASCMLRRKALTSSAIHLCIHRLCSRRPDQKTHTTAGRFSIALLQQLQTEPPRAGMLAAAARRVIWAASGAVTMAETLE